MTDEQPQRRIPLNELDMQFSTVEPVWYDGDIPPQVKKTLTRVTDMQIGDEGELKTYGVDYSKILKLQTRDMRLSKLDGGSYNKAFWWAETATQCAIMGDLPMAAAYCVAERDNILNLRMSMKGWKSELMNTLINKNKSGDDEPKRQSLMGKKGDSND